MATQPDTYKISCRCGQVEMAAEGAPIVTATCHCGSCRRAGEGFAALPGAPAVVNAEGGTAYVLCRKDRVTCVRGDGLLRAHRLTPASATRRVLARCCDSPMFLEFKGGHWLSMYRDRFGADAPPIELQTMTRDRRPGVTLSKDVPAYRTHSVRFMWRLLRAWAAMRFRVPALQPIAEA
jgi:hypothetical protein